MGRLLGKTKARNTKIEKWTEEWAYETSSLGSSALQSWARLTAKILPDNSFDCSFCKGSGEKPMGTRCIACNGKGFFSLASHGVTCAYCNGRGEERSRPYLPCGVCKGRGIVPVSMPVERCQHCLGSGAEPTSKLPCLACHGKGVVSAKARKDTSFSQPLKVRQGLEFFSLSQHHLEPPSPLLYKLKSWKKPQRFSFVRGKKVDNGQAWKLLRISGANAGKGEKKERNISVRALAKKMIAREWARVLRK